MYLHIRQGPKTPTSSTELARFLGAKICVSKFLRFVGVGAILKPHLSSPPAGRISWFQAVGIERIPLGQPSLLSLYPFVEILERAFSQSVDARVRLLRQRVQNGLVLDRFAR